MELSRTAAARAGFQDSLPLAVALLAFGGAFGVHVVQAGLDWWWAPVFGIVAFAGSLEFLLVDLAMGSASLAAVVLTSFLVNSRHAFSALSYPLSACGADGPGRTRCTQ